MNTLHLFLQNRIYGLNGVCPQLARRKKLPEGKLLEDSSNSQFGLSLNKCRGRPAVKWVRLYLRRPLAWGLSP